MKTKIDKFLGKYGRDIIVMRHTGNAYDTSISQNVPTYSQDTVKASVENYSAFQIGGLIQNGDIKVTAVLSSAPSLKDKISIDGVVYRVVFTDTAVFKNDVAVYIIQARR